MEAFNECREGRYASHIRKSSHLAIEYDFTQESRPWISVWLALGSSEDDRMKIWKAMQRVAREAV